MSNITIKIKQVNGELISSDLFTLGEAREVLGYASNDSIYKAIARGEIRCVYISPGHSSRCGLFFRTDVLALQKKREDVLKKKLEKVKNEQ